MDRNETQIGNLFPGDQAPDSTQVRPVLVLFDQSNLHSFYMIVKQETRIGRDPDAEVVIAEDTVSRIHAQIIFQNIDHPDEEPWCVLEDNKSRNGTFLNGRRINEPQRLRAGDRIFIGGTALVYQVRSEFEINADERLRIMATRDAVTGLYNRGFMAIQFQKEFERAQRYQRPLAIMMIDIDDFKKVNDTHGHSVGDLVLEQVARQVIARCRVHDIPARYGGEEFAVMLPETTGTGATVLADRLRRSVESHDCKAPSHIIKVTVSIGVAESLPGKEETLEAFIDRADHALLKAKAEGKNQVVSV